MTNSSVSKHHISVNFLQHTTIKNMYNFQCNVTETFLDWNYTILPFDFIACRPVLSERFREIGTLDEFHNCILNEDYHLIWQRETCSSLARVSVFISTASITNISEQWVRGREHRDEKDNAKPSPLHYVTVIQSCLWYNVCMCVKTGTTSWQFFMSNESM